jgi:hypothetical protein
MHNLPLSLTHVNSHEPVLLHLNETTPSQQNYTDYALKRTYILKRIFVRASNQMNPNVGRQNVMMPLLLFLSEGRNNTKSICTTHRLACRPWVSLRCVTHQGACTITTSSSTNKCSYVAFASTVTFFRPWPTWYHNVGFRNRPCY